MRKTAIGDEAETLNSSKLNIEFVEKRTTGKQATRRLNQRFEVENSRAIR